MRDLQLEQVEGLILAVFEELEDADVQVQQLVDPHPAAESELERQPVA